MSSQQVVAFTETYTGRFIDLLNPQPSDIVLDDIAVPLSRAPRFAGHTRGTDPYTVAQHSVLVWRLLMRLEKQLTPTAYRQVLWLGLLHDAPEAYLTDLPTPLKMIDGIRQEYLRIEGLWMDAILRGLFGNLAPDHTNKALWGHVKWADMMALAIEAHHLMPSGGKTAPYWDLPVTPTPADLALHRLVMSHGEAERQFRHAFMVTSRL
jgi:hypothetical protein